MLIFFFALRFVHTDESISFYKLKLSSIYHQLSKRKKKKKNNNELITCLLRAYYTITNKCIPYGRLTSWQAGSQAGIIRHI